MTTYTLEDLWNKACEFDSINPTDSHFVVFSDDNPWAKKYNTLINLAIRTRYGGATSWRSA